MEINSNKRIVYMGKTPKINYTSKEFRRDLERLEKLNEESLENSKPEKERMYDSFN